MYKGTSTKQVGDTNRLLVLELIRVHAPVTRVEIAQLMGLTAPAVSNIIGGLIKDGVVIETGRRSNLRGQPPIELDINADAATTVGLHLDRDILTGVLVNLKGKILAEVSHEIAVPTPAEAIALLTSSFQELIARSKTEPSKILGIGLCTVGPLDLINGCVNGPPNFSGWNNIPLRQQLANATALPVFLDNNATAAAIGEHWYGVGQAFNDFLYVYLGLGVGGGFFFAGRVHRGVGLNAGEFGHMTISCEADIRPTLESRTSLLALRQELGEDYAMPGQIVEKLANQDGQLLAWLDRSANVMAQAIVSVDNLLDLEVVIFGGRLPGTVLSHYVDRVRAYAERLKMPGRPHYATLEVGRIGDDTAALGAAVLPIYDAFIPDPSFGPRTTFGPSFKNKSAEVVRQDPRSETPMRSS